MSFGERWLLLPFPLLDLFAVKCVHWPILYRVVSLVLKIAFKTCGFCADSESVLGSSSFAPP